MAESTRRQLRAQVTRQGRVLAEQGRIITEQRELLRRIDEAVSNQGPAPEYHLNVLRKHRSEWPTLWRAIDAARAYLHR